MNQSEQKNLSVTARHDAVKLINVSNYLYGFLTTINFLFGFSGLLTGLIVMGTGGIGAGIAVMILTLIICCFIHIFNVISTHVSKVLVHTSMSNIAIMEQNTEFLVKTRNIAG